MLLGNRYYDPEAGRFLSKDPIKDGDNWYAYCNNNPLAWIDPDGLKPGDKYRSMNRAAKQAIKDINPKSIKEHREYAGVIYLTDDGKYSYTPPRRGTKDGSNPGNPPKGRKKVGDYHTHGGYDPGYKNEKFSPADKRTNDDDNIPGYLGTPKGAIRKYIPDPNKKQRGKVINIT